MSEWNPICECTQKCLGKICVSSDSGMTIRKCWCAECKEYRKEIKARAGKITVIRN